MDDESRQGIAFSVRRLYTRRGYLIKLARDPYPRRQSCSKVPSCLIKNLTFIKGYALRQRKVVAIMEILRRDPAWLELMITACRAKARRKRDSCGQDGDLDVGIVSNKGWYCLNRSKRAIMTRI